jgi:hypothetical protein
MKFREEHFTKFNFSSAQIRKNLDNALKDLSIAKRDKILEVKFIYTYTALLKAGIALLSMHKIKIRSIPGHHIKLIDTLAQMLEDEAIADIGHAMRMKRNQDLYAGGIAVTNKECLEYLNFVERVVESVRKMIIS